MATLQKRYAIADDLIASEGVAPLKSRGADMTVVPYLDEAGETLAERVLFDVSDPSAGRWKGSPPDTPYGLARLAEANADGRLIVAFTEVECLALWSLGYAAVAVTSEEAWRALDDSPFLGVVSRIVVLAQTEARSRQVPDWVEGLSFAERTAVAEVPQGLLARDVGLRGDEPEGWLSERLESTLPLRDFIREQRLLDRLIASRECGSLLASDSVLDEFVSDLHEAGVVGEERGAMLLFLCLVTRLTQRPVSVVVKAASSSGKSYLAQKVLDFFPDEAYYALSAMSEKALVYSPEPLRHRFLVIYEAAGAKGEMQDYLLRTLLSENRLRYETVGDKGNGPEGIRLDREGPTGLLMTTTEVSLHAENETRLLSLPVDESPQQTRRIMRALARGPAPEVDVSRWHAFQEWLATGTTAVAVPFAEELMELIDPRSLRVRRDVPAFLSLIAASAMVAQQHRELDEDSRIVATLDDYAIVYSLVADLMAEVIGSTVPPGVRGVVEATGELLADRTYDESGEEPSVSNNELAEYLDLDKSTISRHVTDALLRGYLRNLDAGRRRKRRLVVHEPMPGDAAVLPTPDELGVALLQSVGTRPQQAVAPTSAAPVGPPTAVETDGYVD